jgi:uncharacterized membrane protein YfcA
LIFVSLLIGSITGLFGIGGGFLAIPILVLFFGTPQSTASGTSLMIIALNSLTSLAVRNQSWHEINWKIPLVIAISAIAITNLASRKGSRDPQEKLKYYYTGLLVAIGLFTLAETWIF